VPTKIHTMRYCVISMLLISVAVLNRGLRRRFEFSQPDPSFDTTQPASQSVIVGQPASFSVVATGSTPLNYQWQKNGVAITGETAPTYTTPPTVEADSGLQFRVVVSNSGGETTSNSTIPNGKVYLGTANVELMAPQFFGTQMLGRTAEVIGKLLHRADVAADGVRRIVAPLNILQHALTESGHRNLLPTTTYGSAVALPSLHHNSSSAAPAA
jgi:hypothetical protein